MSFLDVLLAGLKSVDANGAPQRPVRPILNFIGATVADNPTLGTTDITIPGGGAGTVTPLTRTVYVDSGTTSVTHNGSISNPYTTISAALTAIGVPTSSSDANTQYVVYLSPGTYVENLLIPAYRNIGIVAQTTQVIAGSVAWNNSAGGGAVAGAVASLELQNLYVTGNLTVTDDGSLQGVVAVVAAPGLEPNIGGNIDTSGATAVSQIAIEGAYVVGNIVSTANATGATVGVTNGEVDGNIVAKYLFFGAGAFFYGTTFTSHTTADCISAAHFYGTNPVIAGGTYANFDAISYASFASVGGTVTGPMAAVVDGGASRGAVQGSALTDAALTVSIDGGGATSGFTTGGNTYTAAASLYSTNRVLTLGTSGAEKSVTLDVIRFDTSANTLTVKNDAGTTLLVMSLAGQARFTFNGTHFALTSSSISANSGAVTWAGDLAGSTSSTQSVVQLSGGGGATVTVAANVSELLWAAGCVSPEWHQVQSASGGGQTHTFLSQSAHTGSGGTGGGFVIGSGLGDGAGADGTVTLKTGSTARVTVSPTQVTILGGTNGWKVATPGAICALYASGVSPGVSNYTLGSTTNGATVGLVASTSLSLSGGAQGWIVSSPGANCYLHASGVTPSTSNYALVCTPTGTDVAILGSTSATVTGGTTVAIAAGGSTQIVCVAGSISLTEPLLLTNQATSSSATIGAGSALPGLPAGYVTVKINGTNQKIPYFN